ncbi:MAG: hypothetical protein OEL83_05270 [Desulforhopalus sp.]|nr:hypothetical protein [Desulforhopalus sp.]
MKPVLRNLLFCAIVVTAIMLQILGTVKNSYSDEVFPTECADENLINKYANELLEVFKEYSEDINLQKKNLTLPLKKWRLIGMQNHTLKKSLKCCRLNNSLFH